MTPQRPPHILNLNELQCCSSQRSENVTLTFLDDKVFRVWRGEVIADGRLHYQPYQSTDLVQPKFQRSFLLDGPTLVQSWPETKDYSEVKCCFARAWIRVDGKRTKLDGKVSFRGLKLHNSIFRWTTVHLCCPTRVFF